MSPAVGIPLMAILCNFVSRGLRGTVRSRRFYIVKRRTAPTPVWVAFRMDTEICHERSA